MKPIIKGIGATLIIALITGLLTEGALRLAGRSVGRLIVHSNEPHMLEPDPVLGWRNKPGEWIYPGYTPGAADIHVRNVEGGGRATRPGGSNASSPDVSHASRAVVFVGCSFTNGFAISDHETLAWKIQERFPEYDVVNFGTCGWSSYQSLLRLETWFAAAPKPTAFVVYGYNDHHGYRSTGAYEWRRTLDKLSTRGHIRTPYVRLGADGGLVRFPPEPYAEGWPFRRVSSLFAELADFHMYLKNLSAYPAEKRVQAPLVEAMHRLSEQNGARFVNMILVDLTNSTASLKPETPKLDCKIPLRGVPGEGHPDAATNTDWAVCLAKEMERLKDVQAR